MSFHLSLAQLNTIIKATSQNSLPDKLATGISTDTRTLNQGEVFVALRGENFDGHHFIKTAVDEGAIALIVEHQCLDAMDEVEAGSVVSRRSIFDVPQLQVEDTLKAYQTIASWWREQFTLPVIAITGSVGKTTTKEFIAAVLSTKGQVLKTQANYNNEIGVPKTLLGLSAEHSYAVIELAMRAKGEIALLTQIARPTIGVITNVGTAHIGRLGSEAAIAEAKCELLANMPDFGTAILNQDNQRLMETAARVWKGHTVTYGLEGGEVSGKLVDAQTLQVEGQTLPLPLPGRHNALNYLAALAVAKVLGIDFTQLKQGVSVAIPGGRSRRYDLPNDIILLDETYNAGLESMIAALHLLKETPGARYLAILGTMKELGEHSTTFHCRVGEVAKQLQLDYLLVFVDEPETEAIVAGATSVNSECFTSHADLVKRLIEIVQPGDRLLFKASNSIGLNQVVEQFRLQFA